MKITWFPLQKWSTISVQCQCTGQEPPINIVQEINFINLPIYLIPRTLIEKLQNQRPTLVVPPNVSTSVKDIWIGNVLLLETLLVNFLSVPVPFRRKDALGWVWGFLIYVLVGFFNYPERGGELSFRNLDAIESRNFIMSSC